MCICCIARTGAQVNAIRGCQLARALHLSRSTVLRCIKALEECGLIVTEHTDIVSKHGIKRNGNLRYTIVPIQQVMSERQERSLRDKS